MLQRYSTGFGVVKRFTEKYMILVHEYVDISEALQALLTTLRLMALR